MKETAQLCAEINAVILQCTADLARLQAKLVSANAYNQAAVAFMATARWEPEASGKDARQDYAVAAPKTPGGPPSAVVLAQIAYLESIAAFWGAYPRTRCNAASGSAT
jgi:hypothetical protein